MLLLLEIIRAKRKPARPAARAEPIDYRAFLIIAGVVVWTFAYFLIFERLGFMISTSIYLLGLMAYFHRGKWVSNCPAHLGFPSALLFLFKVLGGLSRRAFFPSEERTWTP